MLLEKMSLIIHKTGPLGTVNKYQKRSLNSKRRKVEVDRIKLENQKMLERITQSKSIMRASDIIKQQTNKIDSFYKLQ